MFSLGLAVVVFRYRLELGERAEEKMSVKDSLVSGKVARDFGRPNKKARGLSLRSSSPWETEKRQLCDCAVGGIFF